MRKHVPPSRLRYESKNPVVSIRVPQALKERLETLRIVHGKSVGTLLREALERQEPALAEAVRRGEERGFQQAVDAHAVKFPCKRCGIEILAEGEGIHAAIRQFLSDEGWHHTDCK
jgi:predicted DNA-binding protein